MEKEKLGIPVSERDYIKIGQKPVYDIMQSHGLKPKDVEYSVYQEVAKSFAEWFEELYLFTGEKANIQFINYGDTELVYVLSYGDKKYTMLIGQPTVPIGDIKKESELLAKYAKNDPKSVVAPLRYFVAGSPFLDEKKDFFYQFKKEAFIAPYFMQARCIVSDGAGYGMYVPEPRYQFEKFSEEEKEMICACMVAKLVMLYDQKTQCGISACKLGGGDFILEKEWNREKLDTFDTLKCMRLTAARDEVHCSLEEYISLIRHEFGQRTYYRNEKERDLNIKINHKNRHGMTSSAIEKGIAVGLSLRKTKSAKKAIATKNPTTK